VFLGRHGGGDFAVADVRCGRNHHVHVEEAFDGFDVGLTWDLGVCEEAHTHSGACCDEQQKLLCMVEHLVA